MQSQGFSEVEEEDKEVMEQCDMSNNQPLLVLEMEEGHVWAKYRQPLKAGRGKKTQKNYILP